MAVKEAAPRYRRKLAYYARLCERYADQNEQDYMEFVKAIRSGRLEAVEGV